MQPSAGQIVEVLRHRDDNAEIAELITAVLESQAVARGGGLNPPGAGRPGGDCLARPDRVAHGTVGPDAGCAGAVRTRLERRGPGWGLIAPAAPFRAVSANALSTDVGAA